MTSKKAPHGLSANAWGRRSQLLSLDGDLGDEVPVVKMTPGRRVLPLLAPLPGGRAALDVVTLHQLTARRG